MLKRSAGGAPAGADCPNLLAMQVAVAPARTEGMPPAAGAKAAAEATTAESATVLSMFVWRIDQNLSLIFVTPVSTGT